MANAADTPDTTVFCYSGYFCFSVVSWCWEMFILLLSGLINLLFHALVAYNPWRERSYCIIFWHGGRGRYLLVVFCCLQFLEGEVLLLDPLAWRPRVSWFSGLEAELGIMGVGEVDY